VLSPFTLHRPRTTDDACALLSEHGEEAAPYAGGTELLLLMKMGFAGPRHLVDVKRVAGLDALEVDGARIRIGAAVTHRTVERSAAMRARCPVLADVARHVANVRVRNVGTVGGNLAFADPHSDLATLFLALDAHVELVSPRGRRDLAIAEFARGPWETVRAADELLTAVSFVAPSPGTIATYVKFGVHERPTLGIALALLRHDGERIGAARLAIGCVNPRPMRVAAAEARLAGLTFAELPDVTREVGELASNSVDAVDDLHGSADYKREMVGVFTRRALAAVSARAGVISPRSNGGPARYPYTVIV
jgi:carbon-monoxide dehydrogenase medium subunit